VASTPADEPPADATPERFPAPANGSRRVWLRGGWRKVPCYDRANLTPGATFAGPAVVTEKHAATVVAEGWDVEMDGAGALVLAASAVRPSPATGDESASSTPEAVRLELFVNRFRALVGEMGEMLRRTALSTNVKERLDYSCALLDAEGELVVNAPHIPVHLGALGLCVRSVAAAIAMEPGDVVVTNHPAFGGSHLPDVTVVTPVHDGAGALVGYVAGRAGTRCAASWSRPRTPLVRWTRTWPTWPPPWPRTTAAPGCWRPWRGSTGPRRWAATWTR